MASSYQPWLVQSAGPATRIASDRVLAASTAASDAMAQDPPGSKSRPPQDQSWVAKPV